MRHALRSLLVAAFLAAAAAPAEAQVVTYPAPTGIRMSGDYTVRVGGKTVAVYRGEGADGRAATSLPQAPYSFAYFDYSGSAFVEITSNARPLSRVVLRPASKGVVPTISGNFMSFTLTRQYSHLSIEPDAKNGPLLLFANPIEVNPPTPGTPGVVYFGPGLHQPAGGVIYLNDNQTLYLAGGAVVRAAVDIIGKRNVRIRGRGILDGFPWVPQLGPTGPNRSWRGEPMILAKNCSDLGLEGIILKDSWRFNVGVYSTSMFTATNVKIVSARGENEDGIDFFNSQRVTISDSFLRTEDSTHALLVNWTSVPTTDVTVTRCSLWSDRAECFLIGATGYWGAGVKLGVAAPPMKILRYVDNDVLHFSNRAIMLSGNHNQILEDVRFENIRINHEGQSMLLQVQPAANGDPQTSSPIRNVYFKNIVSTGNAGNYGRIQVASSDSLSPVSNVTFENVVRRGQLALRTSPEVVVGANTSNIVFIASQTGNQPPTLSLSANGASFPAPATVALAATAADGDGTVSRVEFYQGATLLGSDTTSPYAFTWSNVPAGVYSLTAKAVDNSGAVGTSNTVSVTVTGAGSNGAAYVSHTAPASMTAGATATVTIAMRNTGTTTWTGAGKYALGHSAGATPWTWRERRVWLAAGESVAPGATKTFSFSITAPSTAGSHAFPAWRMVQDGVEYFGTSSPALSINVTSGGGGPVTKSFQNGMFPTSSYAGTTDTYLSMDVPTMNFGGSTTVALDGDADGSGSDHRSLLRWDVTAVPGGSTVQSARIVLYVTNSSTEPYEIYRLYRGWNEAQATWGQAQTGVAWQIAGADGTTDRGQSVRGTLTANAAGPATIALTPVGVSMVQAWVSDPASNLGVILLDTANTDGIAFVSSEGTTASQRPRLEITYSTSSAVLSAIETTPADGAIDGEENPLTLQEAVGEGLAEDGGGSGGGGSSCGLLGLEAALLMGLAATMRRRFGRRG